MKRKMLIVDDEALIRKILTEIFSFGFEIQTAVNGAEAVRLVETHKFDIIIIDVVMPVLNGIEATKIIKKIRPDAKIISITGQASSEQKEGILKLNVDAIFDKPLSFNLLKQKVSELLEL